VTLAWQFKPTSEPRLHEVSSDIRGN
jgi:hypothetical protein